VVVFGKMLQQLPEAGATAAAEGTLRLMLQHISKPDATALCSCSNITL